MRVKRSRESRAIILKSVKKDQDQETKDGKLVRKTKDPSGFFCTIKGHEDKLLLVDNLQKLPDSDNNPFAVYSLDMHDLN